MFRRPRRNRKSAAIRAMVEETTLSVNDFIYPVFLIEGSGKREEIVSMPGIYRYTLDSLMDEIQECVDLGIKGFCVFPSLGDDKKDKYATEGHNPESLYNTALKQIKTKFPNIALMTDIAMDPYSSDGHDGIVENGEILNDETLDILGKMALAQAKAGADILGPSDMMDGRVGYIRDILDKAGYTHVSIMSYTAKYASAFYGPFRDALDSAPKFGDKKTYQMNPANKNEALVEADLDISEGADMIMVKPALAYLDIIKLLKDNYNVPITAYNVSGEYAMLKAASEKGWLDGEKVMMESLLSIKRAGADIILTYFAKEAAQILAQK
ncbi:delta-aminolevulinic acid dehydratase [Tenacibaculum sp. SZ-18]|uniref:porphobilinogen synthase n=1 Tax=Tenacibaculum sp. SZ-18 TaxID=754423 RepID=UPI000C2D2E59|nr:porphobilinogen synthase [Tenacibaculum sp. SZ-18]AUC14633.1 delta-aminolevulinic acid dehydratase [Tenacibaculum sp. SZ-18]